MRNSNIIDQHQLCRSYSPRFKLYAAEPSLKTSRGFTLTEIAIVLGIIGIILGAIWAAAASVYENNHNQEATQQVLTIANNWKSIFGSKRVDEPDWTDLTAVTINNHFMPETMIKTGVTTQGYGPWSNSTVTVYAHQSWNGIIIRYNGLTQSACNHFADAVLSGTNTMILWGSVNGTARNFPPVGSDPYFTITDIDAGCAGGGYVQVMYAM